MRVRTEAVDKAERESRTADRILKNLKLHEVDLYVQASKDSSDSTYGRKLSEIAKKIKKAEKVAKEKREKLKSARNVRDYCIGTAYRTCGCATHHTESITSCSCDYNTWNNWCQCPGGS